MSISVVPNRRIRDPRQLLFHFPSIPVVRYAQMAADFYHDQMLRLAEELAHRQGFLLVPASCLGWRKKQDIAGERQVSVGKRSFYMLRRDELTSKEWDKLQEYLEELEQEAG
ncbi:hypothetical protein M4D58_23765 [Brevibacillus borstelensis]|uniref:hypothetical protein n=1 Tax=Brevibacillus borstelensis TaxID=45462 RepID=UPI00203B248D|nr:hypothetical protein [Brevibacillus borstelensis]MCM3593643.1 hypothetical protein [Brevibacillus borstelensis]